MLAILTTHPIQYQVPLWQLLARDGTVPFEVWYLSAHATEPSRDRDFGKDFAWDIDMLEGYPHRFLTTPAGSTPNTPLRLRITQSLPDLFQETGAKVLWVQGWQVAAYWQAVWATKRAGLQFWLRGESNALREQGGTTRRRDDKTTGLGGQGPVVSGRWSSSQSRGPGGLKRAAKRLLLGQFFGRVDQFLCIGSANRDLYRSYGVPEEKLHMALYAVDNERFAAQADELRARRKELREEWSIPEESFCILFCGKFIPKKRPMDLIEAAQLLISSGSSLQAPGSVRPPVHLLFVGSGELGDQMRAACNVAFDAEATLPDNQQLITDNKRPRASFTGFLNQTEISKAYVAADVLVLPSDYGETWGLVVNEAMASGLPCIISDRCGCAPDLGHINGNAVFQCANLEKLAAAIASVSVEDGVRSVPLPSLESLAARVIDLYTGEKYP